MGNVLEFPQKPETKVESDIQQVENELRDSINQMLECRIKYEEISGKLINWEILNQLLKADDVPF